MIAAYRFLDRSLHQYAEAARTFFATDFGIPKTKFEVEAPVHDAIGFTPTLHARTRDHHILAVEVSRTYYTRTLDGFALDCQRDGVPVKLFVAVPPDSPGGLLKDLERAADHGVGIVKLGPIPKVLHGALSLSLTAVRRPDPKEFPAKYRGAVSVALQTFLNGDPAKGCLLLYEEIEHVTRKVAAKADSASAWRRGSVSSQNWEKVNWASMIDVLTEHFDAQKLGCPKLTKALVSRIAGIVPYRNEVGHKPKDMKQLTKRDRELRTRFESAADLLRDVSAAVAPLRV